VDEVDDAPPLADVSGPAHRRARGLPRAPSPVRQAHPAVDEATLAAARRGGRAAREKLLRDLQDPWYRMCLGLLGDAEKARDAVQETAVRFLRQLPGFRGDSQLRTWSLGIALNVAREIKRTRTREAPASALIESADLSGSARGLRGASSSPGPHAAAEASEQRDQLRLMLAHLPDRQREAIVLRFFEELSVEETAVAMNCAPGTVKATVHQALRALRKKLKNLDS
jgi:RNA polymerase sigma-70 factor (ECF subfamily)